MNYTPSDMVAALGVLWTHDPASAERFEAIGLSNMSPDNADALVKSAQRYES